MDPVTKLRRSAAATSGALLVAYVCAGLGACVSKHTLFETDPASVEQGGSAGKTFATGGVSSSAGGQSGTPNSGGDAGADVAPKPWTTCLAAAAQGESGDACVGGFECSFQEDCCDLVTICKSGQLYRSDDCSKCSSTTGKSCKLDDDCDAGQWCVENACAPCAAKQDCSFGWSSIDRHGCAWCVPPNGCTDDSACSGLSCYAGQACLPGCAQDLKCCFGNICAEKGCPTTASADCSRVGCAQGTQCTGSNQTTTDCKCDPNSGLFICSQSGSGNICK